MLKILQAMLQWYVNGELQDIKPEFRKGRGIRDQTPISIYDQMPDHKKREFQKNIYFCFTDYVKAFVCIDHNKLENS